MDEYHAMMREAIEFASTPLNDWTASREQAMKQAGAALDFEAARRIQVTVERTAPIARAEFSHVRRIEDFRYLGVFPAERKDTARLFLVLGGLIEPFVDVPMELSGAHLDDVARALQVHAASRPSALRGDALENLGLVCRHLFKPKNDKTPGELIHLDQALAPTRIARAMRQLARRADAQRDDEIMPDQVLDTLASETSSCD